MKLRLALPAVFGSCLIASSALAQIDLYDDGPTDGTTDAWEINFGFAVSDQFTLSSSAQVNGLQFAAWLSPETSSNPLKSSSARQSTGARRISMVNSMSPSPDAS